MAAKSRTILLVKEKDTKNTVKFAEVPEEGQPPVCGTLYVQKYFVGSAENLKVTIETN